jgi:hypothetical protein
MELYREVIMKTQKCGELKGLVIASVSQMSGEIKTFFTVTPFGGLWYKTDWVTDTMWTPIGEKACELDFPLAWQQILSQLGMIRTWQNEAM